MRRGGARQSRPAVSHGGFRGLLQITPAVTAGCESRRQSRQVMNHAGSHGRPRVTAAVMVGCESRRESRSAAGHGGRHSGLRVTAAVTAGCESVFRGRPCRPLRRESHRVACRRIWAGSRMIKIFIIPVNILLLIIITIYYF